MKKILAYVTAFALVAGFAPVLHAQTPPTQTPPPPTTVTYKSLLDQGFEFKHAMLLSDAVSTRLGQVIQPETVMVTLQKGAVTATCWVTLASWNLHNISGVACNTLK